MDNNYDKLLEVNQLEEKDIPDLNLYMDQVITILNQTMANYKKDEKDKTITKTMINNYVKSKVIPKPIKKKYSKDHVMQLIMIYHLKNVLNIKDVDGFMTFAMETLEGHTEELYKKFIGIQKEVVEEISEHIIMFDTLSEEQLVENFIRYLLYADTYKRVVEEFINNLNNKASHEPDEIISDKA